MQIGTVVKVVSACQFQHTCWIGALTELKSFPGKGLYARVFRWPNWVPIAQLIPVKKGLH
jgi:hypothetical protein